MTILTIEAHCLDADFEAQIKQDYGVTVLDKSGAPWSVDFEGERENLIKMFNDHWTEGNVEEHLIDPSVTWLNMTGDVTITWDVTNEAAMLALIEEKMKQSYSFFIVKPRLLGLLPPKKVLAKNIDEVRKAGKVIADDSILSAVAKPNLGDAAVEQALADGNAVLVKSAARTVATVRRATTAKEVLRNQSVAVRPIVGG